MYTATKKHFHIHILTYNTRNVINALHSGIIFRIICQLASAISESTLRNLFEMVASWDVYCTITEKRCNISIHKCIRAISERRLWVSFYVEKELALVNGLIHEHNNINVCGSEHLNCTGLVAIFNLLIHPEINVNP